MSFVTFSPAAAADLDSIWDYTVEEWGVDQADRYTDDIQNTCNSLARGEKRGRDQLKHSVTLLSKNTNEAEHEHYFRPESQRW